MPVVVNSAYHPNNVNAGKTAGNEPCSIVNAGICLHSGGVGAVPVADFRKSCISSRQSLLPDWRARGGGGEGGRERQLPRVVFV